MCIYLHCIYKRLYIYIKKQTKNPETMTTLKDIEAATRESINEVNEMFEMGMITNIQKANMTHGLKRDVRFAINLTK